MSTSVVLFDIRKLSPGQIADIYECIDHFAFMVSDVSADNRIVGYAAYFERDPAMYLANLPHKCPYRDVSGWDLSDAAGVFRVAFTAQGL